MSASTFPTIHTPAEARDLLDLPEDLLLNIANHAREACSGKLLDLCSILNAKSGACSEDCAFCAQSGKHLAGVKVYPLVDGDTVRRACKSAKDAGARRFCIVTSGRRVLSTELEALTRLVRVVSESGLHPCGTLGFIDKPQLEQLRDAGLHRYHHNLETSESYFPEVCTTHTYAEKVRTIARAKEAGLSICSGGIFGMGETWEDRIALAFALRDLDVDSVPINFLMPVPGTPMESRAVLATEEALRIIALFRMVLPKKEIRICGGRNMVFRERPGAIFPAGANGFLIGNYLTTLGRSPEEDLRMVSDSGYRVQTGG